MKCPKCQFENREGAEFCSECGYKFELICPKCKTTIRVRSRFCDACGYDLSKIQDAPLIDYSNPQSYTPKFLADKIFTTRSSIEGERKLVTVLFADVTNFTSITEKLDPEEVHQIMDSCFKILMDEIHRYEGTINQFTGDGVMALFGAPIAHEDHAQRACYVALAIQRAMIGFNEKLKEEKNIDFKLRFGLNTGSVVVGSIGDDLRMDYTALGDTTNLAARMQQSAKPGNILMTDSTYNLISGHFITESIGELQVKGKEEPVLTYLLKRTRGIRTRMDIAAEKGLSPLTGRSEELNRLHRLWDLSKKGNGQVVFIVGEAGIGKSRLIFEFHRSLSTEKVTWFEGHGAAYGGNMPFLPLIDLLKRNFRIEEGDSEEIVIQKIEQSLSRLGGETQERAPYLKFLFSVDPGDPLIQSMDPQGRRRMIFDSIRLMSIQGSKLRPLILIMEDLHWIDNDSEEFLKSVIDAVATLPEMLILTYRPGYVNPFGERTFYNRISLKAMEEKESLELAKGVIGVSNLPDLIEPMILERAEGNPFYIEEITKSLEEMGAFKRVEAIETAVDLDQIQIPMGIQDVLMARIDRLPEEQKNALQIAAVIGREFAARLFERIAGLEDSASAVLGELIGLELIYQTQFYPELAYMFKHALTHDVAYDNLLTPKRKTIHAQVGEVVEELYSTRLVEYYEMLAHHYERGEVWDKAVNYLVKAGMKARQNYALQAAMTYLNRAKEILELQAPEIPWKTSFDLCLLRGLTLGEQGKWQNAVKEYKSASEIAERENATDLRVQALMSWANATRFGVDVDETLKILKKAEPLVADNPVLTLGIVVTQTQAHVYAGNLNDALEKEKILNDLHNKTDPSFFKIVAAIFGGMLHRWRGDFKKSTEMIGPNLPKLKEGAHAGLYLGSLFLFALALGEQGKFQEAIDTMREGRTFGLEAGEKTQTLKVMNSLGWAFHELCLYDQAISYNNEALDFVKEIVGPDNTSIHEIDSFTRINLGENYLMNGEVSKALEIFETVYENAKKPEYYWGRTRWKVRLLVALGELWLGRGDINKAQSYLDEMHAYHWTDKFPYKKYQVRAGRLQGNIFSALDKDKEAETEFKGALTLAEELGNPTQFWRTHQALGNLLRKQGKSKEARAKFQTALRVVQGIAEDLTDVALKEGYLQSEPIQELLSQVEGS